MSARQSAFDDAGAIGGAGDNAERAAVAEGRLTRRRQRRGAIFQSSPSAWSVTT